MRRVLALFAVGAAIAGLLVASSAIGGRPTLTASANPVETLLPVVPLAGTAATVWDCPGPLPVAGGARSSVSIANPSSRPATASVLLVETEVLGTRPAERLLTPRSETIVIPAHSEHDLVLPDLAPAQKAAAPGVATHHRHGSAHRSSGHTAAVAPGLPSAVEASVSVTVAGPGVAVSETLRDSRGILASACATGSTSAGFTASGVTAGSSSVWLAVFDPTAAPAVVNLAVGTESGLVQPAAYQGLSIAPRSTVLVDIGRYVPLRSLVAVSATATVGRVTIGSLTTVVAHVSTNLLGPGHSYQEAGQALAVGIGKPLTRWAMPLGATSTNDAEAVRIFNPGTHATTVTLESLVPGSPPATLAIAVAAGQTVTADAPRPSQPSGSAGVLFVHSSGGVGIVVDHETYTTVRAQHVVLSESPAVTAASAAWVLPGQEQGPQVTDTVGVTATMPGSTHVVVDELVQAGGGGVSLVRLAAGSVTPDRPLVLHLSSLLRNTKTTAAFGLFVEAASPVLVTGVMNPAASAPGSASSVGAVEIGVEARP